MAMEIVPAMEAGTNLNSETHAPAEQQASRRLSDAERVQILKADSSAKAMQDYTSPQEQDEPAAPIEEQPEAPMPAPIEVAPEGDNGGENAPVPEAVDIEGGEEQNNLY